MSGSRVAGTVADPWVELLEGARLLDDVLTRLQGMTEALEDTNPATKPQERVEKNWRPAYADFLLRFRTEARVYVEMLHNFTVGFVPGPHGGRLD